MTRNAEFSGGTSYDASSTTRALYLLSEWLRFSVLRGAIAVLLLLFGVDARASDLILNGSAVLLLPVLGLSKVIHWINQHRAHAARSRQAQLIIEELRTGKSSQFTLYLRPFLTSKGLRVANSRFRRRFLPSLDRFFGPRIDLETVFAIALERAAHPLIAIGETGFLYGAPKVVSTDATWRQTFTLLAKEATAIIIVPLPRPSTLWELDRLLDDAELLRKTLFVMPMRLRSGVRERLEPYWAEIHDMLTRRGLDFPALAPRGGLFFLDDGGRILHQVDSGGFDIDYLETLVRGLVNPAQIDAIFRTSSEQDRGALFEILDAFLYISPRHGRLQTRPVPRHDLQALFPEPHLLRRLTDAALIVNYRIQEGSQPWWESQLHPMVLDWPQLLVWADQERLRLCAKGIIIESAADAQQWQAHELSKFSAAALALPNDRSELQAPASDRSLAASHASIEGCYLRPEERVRAVQSE